MTYPETLEYLFSRLPMYQRQGKTAFKADLSTTIAFCKALHHPEKKFSSIHVAGTNGKGSVSHYLSAALQKAGLKVGLLTSPHLKDFRERIKINGEMIPESEVIRFVEENQGIDQQLSPSFFEYAVVMGFEYFANQQVDIAIIEVGLGGRLDSTNVITPQLSVITNIGWDHTDILGDSLDKIAREKAGVIKEHVPVVIGKTQPETKNVFLQKAEEAQAPIIFADQQARKPLSSDLLGKYQEENMQTAYIALKEWANATNTVLADSVIEEAFLNVQALTQLQGRWQILQKEPFIVADTAHNKDGLTYTMNQLVSMDFDQLHLVYGSVGDKSIDEILLILPKKAHYYLCKPDVPRGMDLKILEKKFAEKNFSFSVFNSSKEAYLVAKQNLKNNDGLYIGGSTFVVAEIIP